MSGLYLLIKVFPVVLSHESEKSQEGPAEGVKAGVAVVWITASFDTYETLWTEPANTHRYTLNTTCLCFQRYPRYNYVQVNIHLQKSFTNSIHLKKIVLNEKIPLHMNQKKSFCDEQM